MEVDQGDGEDSSVKKTPEEQGWKTIHARNKKNRATDADTQPARQGDAASADTEDHKRRASRNIEKMNAAPKKPHLPKEDIKVIIRPKDGFNTAGYSVAQIGDCILRATGLKAEDVVKDSIRINEWQNIIVVSTPVLERAEKYSAMKDFRIGDTTYEVTAYITAPEDTSKGIIRGIPDYDTSEDIEKSLVNERNPGILHAKRMGRTNHAIIVFQGTYVPRYVYYRSCEYRCVLYKKQYETCYACGGLGHRSDVCPQPQAKRCRGCGSAEPTADHRCEPKCLLCGRDHPTGDRKCKARFKTPYLVKKRQWERKLQENASSERGRTENEKRVDDTTALDDGREHRSRSRSRSRTRSRSRSRKTGDKTQLRASSGAGARSTSTSRSGRTPMQKEGGQAASGHPGPFEVSWADTVSGGRAKVEAAPSNANTETNKELAQIKQMLMQLTKDNAKLRDEISVLKEENARLRNAGKDTKDVAQTAEVPEETIESGEEAIVPTKRRAIEVDSDCSEKRTCRRESQTKRVQEELVVRMEEDKKALEKKMEDMFGQITKLMQQQFATMQQQIQQQLGTMQARVGLFLDPGHVTYVLQPTL
ncbi:hypothetical protein MTO96_030043 [Rhipicephalus appendiculatus]